MNKTLRVFEHQFVNVVDEPIDSNGERIGVTDIEYQALVKFHSKNSHYYSLHHRRIKFKQYVGVLQVGQLIIEVLPKADSSSDDANQWHNALCFMIQTAKNTRSSPAVNTSLEIKRNHLLDIYLYYFLNEISVILHKGLTKKYLFKDENLSSFKGKLNSTKDALFNVADRTRVHCHFQDYSHDHSFNQLLKEALLLVNKMTLNTEIRLLSAQHLLSFERVSRMTKKTVIDQITIDKKHEHYVEGIKLAKMILANTSPDFKSGSIETIAFMFDMNKLFEEFIFKVLKKGLTPKGYEVYRSVKEFWNGKVLKPDILIKGPTKNIVIDTKWKDGESAPSDADLKQIFAYNERFELDEGFLLYPGLPESCLEIMSFHNKKHGCGIIQVSIVNEKGSLSTEDILDQILKKIG